MKQFSNIFIGTAINQQGPLAEHANSSPSNTTTLTTTSELSRYFYHKYYQSSRLTKHTLIKFHKRKR